MLSHLLEAGPPPHSPAVTPDSVAVTEVPGTGPSDTETPTPENPAVLDSGTFPPRDGRPSGRAELNTNLLLYFLTPIGGALC